MAWIKAADAVKEIIKKFELDNKDNIALFTIWDKELGKLAKKIRLTGKLGKVMLVKIDNPTYRQELVLRKKEFVNKINQHYGGKEFVNDIKIEK
jgi:hypothetical protein